MTTATGTDRRAERPGAIEAVPVRHPGQWVAVAIIAVLALMLLHLLVTNPAFGWSIVFQAMIQTPVIQGLFLGTLLGTVGSMIVGVVLGVVLAVMRLSPNRVLSTSSWAWLVRPARSCSLTSTRSGASKGMWLSTENV